MKPDLTNGLVRAPVRIEVQKKFWATDRAGYSRGLFARVIPTARVIIYPGCYRHGMRRQD
jgi:hypothetical protein